MISADKVGATLLGYPPECVPHIYLTMSSQERVFDLSDLEIKGDIAVEEAINPLKYVREHSETEDMPQLFEAFGVKGIRLPQVDNTLCTYCVPFFAYATAGIVMSQKFEESFYKIRSYVLYSG